MDLLIEVLLVHDDDDNLWSFCCNIYHTGNGSFELMRSSGDSQNGNNYNNVCARMTGVGRLVWQTLPQQQVPTTTKGNTLEEAWLALLDPRRVGSLGDDGVLDVSTVLAVLVTALVGKAPLFRNEWVQRLTTTMLCYHQQQPAATASICLEPCWWRMYIWNINAKTTRAKMRMDTINS